MDELNYSDEYPPITSYESKSRQSEESSSPLVHVHHEHKANVTYEKQVLKEEETKEGCMTTHDRQKCIGYLEESSTCDEDTSSKSHSFAYDISRNTTLLGQTYSDSYFNQSLERMYDRYLKNELSRTESDEQPTGCFDKTTDTENPKSRLERCNRKQFVIVSTTVVCMLVAATVAAVFTLNGYHSSTDHFHGTPQAEENAEVYQHAAVVTGSSLCTKIGADILRKNGSAVDAAIASTFCLCVASKHTASIGGGGYMLTYNRHNQTFSAYDFSAVAPGKAKMDMFDGNNNTINHNRGRYIGVPGIVKGLFRAWQKHGVLPWKDIVEPALNITKYGVLVQVRSHEIAEMLKDKIEVDPGLRKLLLSPIGEPWVPGHLLIDPELMNTLEVIAENPQDFYDGELATKIVKDISKVGGLVSLDDMANYKVRSRSSVTSVIKSFELHTIGLPTGGPVVTDLLNILKGYHFKTNDVDGKQTLRTSLTYHRIIEAMKFAHAHRTQEGDPDYNEPDLMNELVNNMTDEGTAEKFRQNIDDRETKDEMYYEPSYQLPSEGGGSQVSVIGPNGDAVSMTTTINSWYGSMYRSLNTGIIYNDQMKAFNSMESQPTNILPSSPINSIHGGKRPLTSISPIIMIDKRGGVRLVLGGSGGSKIIPAVAQVIINKLWFDDALGQAVFKPRIYYESTFNITVENAISPSIVDGLRQRKHTVTTSNELEYSAVQAIYVDESGDIHAKSDARKYGHSDGY